MSSANHRGSDSPMSAWEKNLLGVKMNQIHLLLPGLLAAGCLALVSIWVSTYVGCTIMGFDKTPISAVTVAIVLGLIVSNAGPMPKTLLPGLRFVVKKVLRLGIIVLGIRLSVFDVFKLGALGLPIVLLCIGSALFFASLMARWLRLPQRLGILIAVGTSICGVSAIVAMGPAIDAYDEEVAYAVATITIFGIIATLAYPYVAGFLFPGDPTKAGLFLGTAIHDTSQVTGAAVVFADVFSMPRALDVATVTKLVRNVLMAVVIPLVASYYHRRINDGGESGGQKTSFVKYLPLFVVGFLAMAVFRSIGDAGVNVGSEAYGLWGRGAWGAICGFIKHWAVNLLVVALAGVGLSTNLSMLKRLGIKPFVAGLCAATVVGVVSVISVSLLGAFVAL